MTALHEVARLLSEDPSRTWTTTQIAAALKVPPKGAVRMTLSRAVKHGFALRVAWGVYQSPKSLVGPALPHPDLRVHGIKIETRYNSMGWSFLDVSQKVAAVWPSPGSHIHPRNRSFTTRADWRGRYLTVTVHREKSSLVEVFLQSSEYPLPLLDLYAFFASVETATGIPAQLWTLAQADWNIDIPGFGKIGTDVGFTSLSVNGFGNLIAKVYEKAHDIMRTEIRVFEPMQVGLLADYIRSLYGTLMREKDPSK